MQDSSVHCAPGYHDAPKTEKGRKVGTRLDIETKASRVDRRRSADGDLESNRYENLFISRRMVPVFGKPPKAELDRSILELFFGKGKTRK